MTSLVVTAALVLTGCAALALGAALANLRGQLRLAGAELVTYRRASLSLAAHVGRLQQLALVADLDTTAVDLDLPAPPPLPMSADLDLIEREAFEAIVAEYRSGRTP